MLTKELVLDLWSKTYNTEGKPDWAHMVINKIQNSGLSILTPIPSIYQAGQWAYSPAGVPMSILTGKLASDKVLKQIRKSKNT